MLEEYLRYLQYEKNYSTHTVLSYKKDIEQFLEYYKSINKADNILEAEREDIRLWVASLCNLGNLTPRSICRKISSLKSFYKYLLYKGFVSCNPVNIVAPKIAMPLPVFFTDKEMDKLDPKDVVCFTDFESVRDALIVEILYQTGIRRTELINLKIEDIDFSRKTIKVLGKRKKERFIPFGEVLEKMIKHYLQIKSKSVVKVNNCLFVRKNGASMYDKAIYKIVTRQLSTISTKSKYSPHTLRHSFATTLLDNGAELNAVKKMLGHSSLTSTQIYTHTSFKELQRLYNDTHPRAN